MINDVTSKRANRGGGGGGWTLYQKAEHKMRTQAVQSTHINNMEMFQILTLPLLVFTTLTVESSDPVATSTLSLCASMQVTEPW